MKTQNELLRIKNALSGTQGLIYIMFLGRQTYVTNFQDEIVKAGIFKTKENVPQAFARLRNEENPACEYLKFIKELDQPGKPKILTANLEPVWTTLSRLKIEYNQEAP